MKRVRSMIFLACLVLLTHGAARAQGPYSIQAIVNGGDRAGDLTISRCGGRCYDLPGLNDAGEAVIYAQDSARRVALVQYGPGGLTPIVKTGDTLQGIQLGTLVPGFQGPSQSGHTLFMGQDSSGHVVLAQQAAGTAKVTVIAAVGGNAPGGGTWSYLPTPTVPFSTLNMNDRGNAVFYGFVKGGAANSSTFHWDSQMQSVTPVVVKGMKAGDITLDGDLSYYGAAINNQDELLLGASGKDGAGKSVQGLFFLDRKQNLRPVALIGQALPDGDQLGNILSVALNDLGTIALVVSLKSDYRKEAVYRWADGTLTATGIVGGADAPIGGKFAAIAGLRLNNVNGNLLVAAHLNDDFGRGGFFLFAAGQLKAVSAPGQKLADGATSGGFTVTAQVSAANAAGQICFVTWLSDGAALYLMQPDGRLSQALKTGVTTSLGSVFDFPLTAGFANGIALNGKGQIALPVTLDNGASRTEVVALLTPVAL
jgi:hypothetical protein